MVPFCVSIVVLFGCCGLMEGLALNGLNLLFTSFHPLQFLCILVVSFVGGLLYGYVFRRLVGTFLSTCVQNAGTPPYSQCTEIYQLQRALYEFTSTQRNDTMILLLSRLSHELNTSLHAILGAAQLLSEVPVEQDLVSVITHTSKVMANLVSDFLDLSQCQHGQLQIHPHSFLLSRLMGGVERVFSVEAQRTGISLSFVAHPGTPLMIHGDCPRIKQILTSLLCNAFRATYRNPTPGRITVMVSLCNDSKFLHFTVTDNGCGIPPEEQPRLFTPFYQPISVSPNTQQVPGCGLGLCLCQHIVNLLGGTIHLHSAFGEGTTVTFTIPVKPFQGNTTNNFSSASLLDDVASRISRFPAFCHPRRISRPELVQNFSQLHPSSGTGSLSRLRSEGISESSLTRSPSCPLNLPNRVCSPLRGLNQASEYNLRGVLSRASPSGRLQRNSSRLSYSAGISSTSDADLLRSLHVNRSPVIHTHFSDVDLHRSVTASESDLDAHRELMPTSPLTDKHYYLESNDSLGSYLLNYMAYNTDHLASISRCSRTVLDSHSETGEMSTDNSASQIQPTSPGSTLPNSVNASANPPLLFFVVDDNAINRVLLMKLLTQIFRCDVHCSGTGVHALEDIQQKYRPDLKCLCLTDIHMPEMDGIELSSKLRTRWNEMALPIIGVTADHTAQVRTDCLDAGMQAVLMKPVLRNHLAKTITVVMTSLWGDLPDEYTQ